MALQNGAHIRLEAAQHFPDTNGMNATFLLLRRGTKAFALLLNPEDSDPSLSQRTRWR
jgi:hypothetical protein